MTVAELAAQRLLQPRAMPRLGRHQAPQPQRTLDRAPPPHQVRHRPARLGLRIPMDTATLQPPTREGGVGRFLPHINWADQVPRDLSRDRPNQSAVGKRAQRVFPPSPIVGEHFTMG